MSLYPQDQEINMFGEILKYPNMGEDGKFTNGSFSDPKIKPSFIPAETINLILDNLENVMKEANIETNTENTNQLKDAVKKIINNSQNNLEAKINKEITDRTQADTTLQNNINTEKALPSNGTEVKMPYTIDGKAVYKRFWGKKQFKDGEVIITMQNLGITDMYNIISAKSMAITIGGFYIQQVNLSGGDSACVMNAVENIQAYVKGSFVYITNVEIEYIKG